MQCLFISVALLSACGGGNDPAPAPPTSGTPTPAPTPPAPPAPTPPAPPPPPAPTPPAPPPSSGLTYYFSDCVGIDSGCTPGDNNNLGTSEAAPKQSLPPGAAASEFANRLPPGSRLLFKRGGAWNWSPLLLEKDNIDPSVTQLVFDAYGESTRPLPLMRVNASNGEAIVFGGYNNTSLDGGYAIRNLKFDGLGIASVGFFLSHNLRNVTFENNEITGFHLGIQSQSRAPHGVSQVLIRNNSISRNRGMGILGQFNDSTIEDNLFEANNISGSGLEHGTYLSGSDSTWTDSGGNTLTHRSGSNVTLRNNRYIRNSVVTGPVTIDLVTTTRTRCTGGNMTFHGFMDNLLIEGNTIVQDPLFTDNRDEGGSGCYLMTVAPGYEGIPEGLTRVVVRNNRLINGGNTALSANSVPGIRIEGNVFINEQPVYQTAIGLGNGDYRASSHPSGVYPNGDLADGNAVVHNNTVCRSGGATGATVIQFAAPGTTITGTTEPTGTAATSGVCAR